MCTVCALGMYKPVSGDTTCQSCLANADRPAESISFEACLCNAGFSGSDWNGGSSNLNKKGLSYGVMVTVTLISIFAILALFCGVPRYSDMCNMCKAVSAAIQRGEDRAGAEAASEQHNQSRTLALNTGWIGGDYEPLEIQQMSLFVNESKLLSSLQQQTSS